MGVSGGFILDCTREGDGFLACGKAGLVGVAFMGLEIVAKRAGLLDATSVKAPACFCGELVGVTKCLGLGSSFRGVGAGVVNSEAVVCSANR